MGKIIKNHRNWGQPVFFSSPLRGLSLMELTSREKKVISASVIDSSSRWQKANGLCHGQLFQSRQ